MFSKHMRFAFSACGRAPAAVGAARALPAAADRRDKGNHDAALGSQQNAGLLRTSCRT